MDICRIYVSAGSASFCYDANGNLTADGSNVYLYDVENRLVERRVQGANNNNCNALSYSGASTAKLRYDPTGRLYGVKAGSSAPQSFVYDGNAMIAEYNASGTMLRRYVHGSNAEADDPLVWYEGSTVATPNRRILHADPRGSIIAVTDYRGQRVATNTYDEFGIPDTASGNDISTKGRFRYTGQVWLPELGMYYYKARIYSPTLGRFLQTDPIGYEDQFNLYAYVGNDPINAVDPTGECGRRYGDGSCKVKIKGKRTPEKIAAQKDLESSLNTYDKAINSLGDKDVITTSSGDRLTGKEIKTVWNGTKFEVNNKQWGNGALKGGAAIGGFDTNGNFKGRIALSSGEVADWGNGRSVSGLTNFSAAKGVTTLVFHELGHLTKAGGQILAKYPAPGALWNEANDRKREAETDKVGQAVANSVGAPYVCAISSGC